MRLALALPALAAAAAANDDAIERRQDYSELIQLASLADVPLPSNPAELLSLAPLASKLLAALPTAPVLEALETAAPPGFLSQVIHDPAFAASFESAFAAGHSPSWFTALPTSILSYLHTYDGLGTAAGDLNTVESVIASVSSASVSSVAVAKSKATAAASTNGTASAAASATTSGASQTGAGISAGAGASGAGPVTGSATPTGSATGGASSVSSAGGAAHREVKGLMAALGAVGAVLGAAVVL